MLNRRRFLQSTGTALGAWGLASRSLAAADLSGPPFRVTLNLAGAEFGTNNKNFSQANRGVLGRDFTFNNRQTVQYFCDRGVRTFRIPISWERIQPKLGGPLDNAYIEGLTRLLAWTSDAGGSAILDLHNYGRYRLLRDGHPSEAILGQSVEGKILLPVTDLTDVWRRLATQFVANPAIVAYGIMNEPHNMEGLNWHNATNQVVTAIRKVDAARWICVSGADWATSQNFVEANGEQAWIKDPLGKTIYEAHAYLDADRSGKYELTFKQELARDPEIWNRPQKVLQPFLAWCQANRVNGYVGEIGVPNTDSNWLKLLAESCSLIREANAAVGYWAAGEWWNDYPLSVQPKSFDSPLPAQMSTVVESMQ